MRRAVITILQENLLEQAPTVLHAMTLLRRDPNLELAEAYGGG